MPMSLPGGPTGEDRGAKGVAAPGATHSRFGPLRLRRRGLAMLGNFAAIGCLVTWACAAAVAQPVALVADFAAAPGNGSYSFASTTPANLFDLVDAKRPRPAQTIVGHLSLPAGEGKVPAVLLLHGSGGVYPELQGFWTQQLNAVGMASLVIDMFGPRGVQSTGDDQSKVPMAADVADAFAALGLLASHPRIDAKRIGVMGFSRGGITVLRTAVNRIAAGSAPPGLRFAAHLPVYSGGCAGQTSISPQPGVYGSAPLLFIHGEDDDYTYAAVCQDLAARMAAVGVPTEFVGLPGARHKFDASDPRRIHLRQAQKTKADCPLEWDIQAMAFLDRRSGEKLSSERAREVQRESCSTLGATMEGNAKARDRAAAAAMAFLQRVLAP